MTSPQVVVFDLGKVLLDFDYGKMARKLAARGNISAPEVRRVMDHSPLLFRFETGLMTKEQLFAAVVSHSGFRGTMAEFEDAFSDIFEPIAPMVRIHAALREQGMPTCIFSNTNELAVAHILKKYPFINDFDNHVYSYEHGAMKPDSKLYAVVEGKTGRQRDEILYIDDRAENVAAGASRGWRVILQETPEKTRAAVQAAGLKV